jgi:hypothetical protein
LSESIFTPVRSIVSVGVDAPAFVLVEPAKGAHDSAFVVTRGDPGFVFVVPPHAARRSGKKRRRSAARFTGRNLARGAAGLCHSFGTVVFHTRSSGVATVAPMAKAATPWGSAELVEELTVVQRAGDKRFSSLVQLLEAPGGERLVRFAYATAGTARRGPVTFRARDLERLRAGLEERPRLAEALGLKPP